LLILGAAGTTAAQSLGRCVSAELPAPMVLPDGSVHDAVSFRVCMERNLSPVSGLHKAYIDGFPTGFLTSRRVATEGARRLGPPFFVFEKNGDSEKLRLIALAVRDGRKMATFVFADPAPVRANLAVNKRMRSKDRYSFVNRIDDGSFMIAVAQ
jgi:hypothetical protein